MSYRKLAEEQERAGNGTQIAMEKMVKECDNMEMGLDWESERCRKERVIMVASDRRKLFIINSFGHRIEYNCIFDMSK